ncbi:MAG: sugar transferase [Clostridia bacterium]|nr:sugar transferase [Clostridia bacterium]
MLQQTQLEPNPSPVYRFLKRCGDILLSAAGLLVLSPVFLIVSLLIWLEDRGSVIFCQERNGLNNQVFKMYKFRSMVSNADKLRAAMEKYNELDGPAFKMKDDPRITRIGRFIRKTSIDELPQLWNILRGEMSLVGPRPLPTYETAQCNDYQMQRLLVKPGLTCYWQVSGRSDISFDEWIELDLKYIREASVITDLKILLQTVTAVLGHKGAY